MWRGSGGQGEFMPQTSAGRGGGRLLETPAANVGVTHQPEGAGLWTSVICRLGQACPRGSIARDY